MKGALLVLFAMIAAPPAWSDTAHDKAVMKLALEGCGYRIALSSVAYGFDVATLRTMIRQACEPQIVGLTRAFTAEHGAAMGRGLTDLTVDTITQRYAEAMRAMKTPASLKNR